MATVTRTEPPPLPDSLGRLPPPLPPSPDTDTPPDAALPEEGAPVAVMPPPLPVEPQLSTFRYILRHPFRSFFEAIEWCFGLVSMLVGLALLSVIPIVQFLCLGYMLESAARIARSGRIRDGFIGIRPAARLGGIVLASWLLLLPLRFLSDVARSAEIINPGGSSASQWRLGTYALTALIALHIVLAVARGGKLRYFLWPFNFISVIIRMFRGQAYVAARDAVWDRVVSMRLWDYWWLGVRGYVAGFIWLVIPVSMLAAGQSKSPAGPVLSVFGGMLLIFVLMYLPFLQIRLAVYNRFKAAFQLCAVRRTFARAPYACATAYILTLTFAIPLYLLKIEVIPREASWLPAMIFIAFIFPARLLGGWAMGRALRREEKRHWFFRITAKVPLLPAGFIYVLFVFFSQYTSWNGVVSLYEQHAFLLPIPIVGS